MSEDKKTVAVSGCACINGSHGIRVPKNFDLQRSRFHCYCGFVSAAVSAGAALEGYEEHLRIHEIPKDVWDQMS